MDRLCKVGDVIYSNRLRRRVTIGHTVSLSDLENTSLSNNWLVVETDTSESPDNHGAHSVIVVMMCGSGGSYFEDVMKIRFSQTGRNATKLTKEEITLVEMVNIVDGTDLPPGRTIVYKGVGS